MQLWELPFLFYPLLTLLLLKYDYIILVDNEAEDLLYSVGNDDVVELLRITENEKTNKNEMVATENEAAAEENKKPPQKKKKLSSKNTTNNNNTHVFLIGF